VECSPFESSTHHIHHCAGRDTEEKQGDDDDDKEEERMTYEDKDEMERKTRRIRSVKGKEDGTEKG
jgi:hypothetical protein